MGDLEAVADRDGVAAGGAGSHFDRPGVAEFRTGADDARAATRPAVAAVARRLTPVAARYGADTASRYPPTYPARAPSALTPRHGACDRDLAKIKYPFQLSFSVSECSSMHTQTLLRPALVSHRAMAQ